MVKKLRINESDEIGFSNYSERDIKLAAYNLPTHIVNRKIYDWADPEHLHYDHEYPYIYFNNFKINSEEDTVKLHFWYSGDSDSIGYDIEVPVELLLNPTESFLNEIKKELFDFAISHYWNVK